MYLLIFVFSLIFIFLVFCENQMAQSKEKKTFSVRCISIFIANAKSCSELTLCRINHINNPRCEDGNSLSLQVVSLFASGNEVKRSSCLKSPMHCTAISALSCRIFVLSALLGFLFKRVNSN